MSERPEDWVIVPKGLTYEILDALDFTEGDPSPERRWQAILDAAPKPDGLVIVQPDASLLNVAGGRVK